jgi:hypothetical protein
VALEPDPLFFLWLAQVEQKARLEDQKRQELAETQSKMKEAEDQIG